MKKIYSLFFAALLAAPAFAQEEDVTHYITNPGFDEDMTFLSDGSAKHYNVNGSLSARSHKWVTEDGTIYAASKTSAEGNGNWKRNDTNYSFNGFQGHIKGWELATGSSGEWTYFGAVPYSLQAGSTNVGIADDNNGSWLTVAPKPAEANTDDNTATLYLRAGWTNYAEYSQVVKLPCAQYRLEYWINNMNYAATDASGLENRCEIICRKEHFKDDAGVNANGWQKHTIEFTPTAEFTIKMGFKAGNYGSGKNPILLIDGLKLFKIGEADKVELLTADLNDVIDSLTVLSEAMFSDAHGIQTEIREKCIIINDAISEGNENDMQACFNEMDAYIAKLNGVPAKFEGIDALLDKAAEALENTGFPGLDDFQTAIAAIEEYKDNGYASLDKEVAASDYIDTVIENLNKAINTYYESQEATPENPADFTHFVNNPTFAEQGSWYIGESGGDQTIKTDKTDNDGNQINCWNAWRNTMVEGNSVSIQQDITGIKNGKYSITADMNTQDGCITNQHLYVKSSIAEGVSPIMIVTGWNPCVWETLTSEPVIVVDGKLTIGAIGVSDGLTPDQFGGTDTDQRRGWFNLANVKLNYLGEVTPKEMINVTHLIQNPDFDSDLTFHSDGTMKNIIEKEDLSTRSNGLLADDGTLYCVAKTQEEGNTMFRRTDVDHAINGFHGQIQGWTLETYGNDWTYFGAIPYDIEAEAIPIAEDNDGSWLTMSSKPAGHNSADNIASLYLRAGWGNYAEYTQVVKVPCACYRLEYFINNLTDVAVQNPLQIQCRRDTLMEKTSVDTNGWEKHTIDFAPISEFTIKMGFQSTVELSNRNPLLLVDGIKLYMIGKADKIGLIMSDLNETVCELLSLRDNDFVDTPTVQTDINIWIDTITGVINERNEDNMEKCLNEATIFIAKIKGYPHGDVNLDRAVNVGDYTTEIDIILENSTPNYEQFKQADVNDDNEINIGDVTCISNIILGIQPNAYSYVNARTAQNNSIAAELVAIENGISRYAIQLDNATPISAIQLDVEGARLAGQQIGSRANGQSIMANCNRVVVAGLGAGAFSGNNGTLLYIDVEGTGSLKNIVASDLCGNTLSFGDINLDEATGIATTAATTDSAATIYSANGVHTNALNQGINIIRKADGTVTKVIVK